MDNIYNNIYKNDATLSITIVIIILLILMFVNYGCICGDETVDLGGITKTFILSFACTYGIIYAQKKYNKYKINSTDSPISYEEFLSTNTE